MVQSTVDRDRLVGRIVMTQSPPVRAQAPPKAPDVDSIPEVSPVESLEDLTEIENLALGRAESLTASHPANS